MAVPVVLDCDPGHDDAMAILLAAADPRIDLLAITTVAGNQTLEKTTLNARRICSVAAITDVPIAAGCDRPLTGPLVLGDFIHGRSGLDGPAFGDVTVELDARHAVELMREVLVTAAEPVTLIATGPLTNVAMLLRDHREIRDRIREIVFMGGSTERGNYSPYAEFNIAVDPEAAELVLESGVPVSMCGLNVSHQVLVTDDVLQRLKAVDTRLAGLCVELMTYFAATYRQVFGFDHPPLHDPIVVAMVAEPTIVSCARSHVAIETLGRHTRGATVVDLHGRSGSVPNAAVAVGIDHERFWDLMLDAVRTLG